MRALLTLCMAISFSTAMTQSLQIEEKVKFLALGDSYTIGQSVAVEDRWPVQLIDSLRLRGLKCDDAKIIATTGWRTDDLKQAIVNAKLSNAYNLVGLLIGVNNFYQGKSVASYIPEFDDLLTTAIKLAGGVKSHVFVVSIPDYGYTPFGQSNQAAISKGIDDFNAANKGIAGSKGVSYFDITPVSRRGLADPALVAVDGLHPSGKQYTEWVKIILKGSTIIEPTGSITPPDTNGTVTGVNDERMGINIYPNPFGKQLVFENLPEQNRFTIEIVNASGSIALRSELISTSRVTIDTSSLSSGMYYYQVISRKGILLNGKVIKI